MKIHTSIVNELSPTKINELIQEVNNFSLSERLGNIVSEYSQLGERKMFIWKWLFMINLNWKHLNIDDKYTQNLAEVKTFYNMFIVLLDDVAEQKGREDFLHKLVSIPQEKDDEVQFSSEEEKNYYQFTKKVWEIILSDLSKYPFFLEHKEEFLFDTKQFINAVLYANLIFRKPYLISQKEFWLYIPHSMQILIDFDMDLMLTKVENNIQIGRAREVVLTLQEMGRIGNWLSTWEREVAERDYSSLVVAKAIYKGFMTLDEKSDVQKAIEEIKKAEIEEEILNIWDDLYAKLELLSKACNLTKTNEILDKAKYLLQMHLSSRGFK